MSVVLAVTTGLAYVLFKHFAQGWLDGHFARRLEGLRHEQARDLEAMRYQISGLLDRTTRLNDAEFRVLPEAWTLLKEAFFETLAHTGSIKSYPDFDRMNEQQLEEHLAESPLLESQKQELREATEKTRAYPKMIYWHQKQTAESAARKFARFVEFNGLWLPEKETFRTLSKFIWDALTEYSLNEEHDMRPREREKIKALEKEGRAAMDELEAKLGARIWTVELPRTEVQKAKSS